MIKWQNKVKNKKGFYWYNSSISHLNRPLILQVLSNKSIMCFGHGGSFPFNMLYDPTVCGKAKFAPIEKNYDWQNKSCLTRGCVGWVLKPIKDKWFHIGLFYNVRGNDLNTVDFLWKDGSSEHSSSIKDNMRFSLITYPEI